MQIEEDNYAQKTNVGISDGGMPCPDPGNGGECRKCGQPRGGMRACRLTRYPTVTVISLRAHSRERTVRAVMQPETVTLCQRILNR